MKTIKIPKIYLELISYITILSLILFFHIEYYISIYPLENNITYIKTLFYSILLIFIKYLFILFLYYLLFNWIRLIFNDDKVDKEKYYKLNIKLPKLIKKKTNIGKYQ